MLRRLDGFCVLVFTYPLGETSFFAAALEHLTNQAEARTSWLDEACLPMKAEGEQTWRTAMRRAMKDHLLQSEEAFGVLETPAPAEPFLSQESYFTRGCACGRVYV